jgi:uncharacterized membrane protein YdjX (TVP38/TMEM64 family)
VSSTAPETRSDPSAAKARRRFDRSLATRMLLLAVLILPLGWALHEDMLAQLDVESLERLIRRSGVWGPVLYVLLFALLEPFGVAGIVFVIPASLVWPAPTAILLSWIGAVAAGLVGLTFARTVGREWVQSRLPDRFRRFDERLATRGVVTVAIVRLVFAMAPPGHWALGLSHVSVPAFLLGSAIGFLPWVVALTLLGQSTAEWLSGQPNGMWLAVALAAAAFALLRSWRRGAELSRSSHGDRAGPGEDDCV